MYTGISTKLLFCVIEAFMSLFLMAAIFSEENSCFYFFASEIMDLIFNGEDKL